MNDAFSAPDEPGADRHRGWAFLLYLTVPGLGHLYLGWLGWAAVFALVVPVTTVLAAIGMLAGGLAGTLIMSCAGALRMLLGGLGALQVLGKAHPRSGLPMQTPARYLAWGVLAWTLHLTTTVGIRTWVAEPFQIPAGSMSPTLLIGDHIVAHKYISASDLKRGDIVAFYHPKQPSQTYVKRVVALPGDTISLQDGTPILNGVPLARTSGEPTELLNSDCRAYLSTPIRETLDGRSYTILASPHGNMFRNRDAVTVPSGHLFVMGDNRDNSLDSRAFGFVPFENVVGRADSVHFSVDDCTGSPRWQRWGLRLSD